MGIFEKLKIPFGSSRRSFRYECENCHVEFESPHADMSRVSCPECRSGVVRGLPSR